MDEASSNPGKWYKRAANSLFTGARAGKSAPGDYEAAAARVFPQSAGGIAALTNADGAPPVLLIEDDLFWECERSPEPTRMLREATGLESLEVHFVPRLFFARTAEGQIDRDKTLEYWRGCQTALRIGGPTAGYADTLRAFTEEFAGVPADLPLSQELDSLGLVMLRLFCEKRGLTYTPTLSFEAMARAGDTADRSQGEVFSIVALMDGRKLGFDAPKPFIDEPFLQAISAAVGMPVHFEQITVPPVLVLFSDLIFHDYFLPRNPSPAYSAVSAVLNKIKRASLILVDDHYNCYAPPYCAYPVLDWQFLHHPEAELLGHRLQSYIQNHHLLPHRVLMGRAITPETVSPAIKNLESYLQTPIFRLAFYAKYSQYTADWEYRDLQEPLSIEQKRADRAWIVSLREQLLNFIAKRAGQFRSYTGLKVNNFTREFPNFCSFLMNRDALEFVIHQYNSFYILGQRASVSYITRRLEELGKPYYLSSRFDQALTDYECMVLTGATGDLPATNKPIFDFMQAGTDGGGRPRNVHPLIEALCPCLTASNERLYRAVTERYGPDHDNTRGNFLLSPSEADLLALFPMRFTVPQALEEAVRFIESDQLSQAEMFCAKILEVEPGNRVAVHLLNTCRNREAPLVADVYGVR
jgi:hypothetical protein